MNVKRSILAAVTASVLAGFSGAAWAATPTLEELYKIIQQQQAEIDSLKKRGKVVEERLDYTAEAVEKNSASSASELFSKTSIGGYGEHHFNRFNNKADVVDAHRFVMFFGHEFADDLRFFSELEVEHGLVKDTQAPSTPNGGEVELEQAYIEWDFADKQRVKIGQFLIPVGIMNETHEPDTFYGTERNNVEAQIIPSTWWETGVMFSGEIVPGLSYDAGVHSGLKMADGGTVRGGRQKSANATADDLAYTARLKYTGLAGLELAATAQYQEEVTQDIATDKSSGTLWEAHAIYQLADFNLRALYATWDINGAAFDANGRDTQTGWYVEPSYKITDKLGVFTRYSEWDSSDGTGGVGDTTVAQVDWGLNYWLHPRVVLKMDWSEYRNNLNNASTSSNQDAFNLGVGWSF